MVRKITEVQCFRGFIASYLISGKFENIINETLKEAYEYKTGVKTPYTVSSDNFEIVMLLVNKVPWVLKESGYSKEDYKLILSKLCSEQ